MPIPLSSDVILGGFKAVEENPHNFQNKFVEEQFLKEQTLGITDDNCGQIATIFVVSAIAHGYIETKDEPIGNKGKTIRVTVITEAGKSYRRWALDCAWEQG